VRELGRQVHPADLPQLSTDIHVLSSREVLCAILAFLTCVVLSDQLVPCSYVTKATTHAACFRITRPGLACLTFVLPVIWVGALSLPFPRGSAGTLSFVSPSASLLLLICAKGLLGIS
jgi:hypothetical protein